MKLNQKKSKTNYQDMSFEEYKAKLEDFIKRNPPKLEIPEFDTNNVEFLKQIPVHPRNRLSRKIKKEIKNENKILLTSRHNKNDVEFIKQTPVHPRNRLRHKIKKKIKNENKIILPTSHSLNLI